jgi:uncharacterized protein YkwD
VVLAAGALGFLAPAPAHATSACPDAYLQPTPANVVQVEAATLCAVNEQRVQNGLAPLTLNTVLQGAALEHSQDMVQHHFFSHDSNSGEDFEDRILRFQYAPTNVQFVAGENLAWGTLSLSTPDAIVTSWMNSPEHRANMLSPDFKELGVGVVASTPSGDPTGATYTADFGAHASAPPRAATRRKSHHKHRSRHKKKHRRGSKHCSTGSAAVTLC